MERKGGDVLRARKRSSERIATALIRRTETSWQRNLWSACERETEFDEGA